MRPALTRTTSRVNSLVAGFLLTCIFSLSFYSPLRFHASVLECPGTPVLYTLDFGGLRIRGSEKRETTDSSPPSQLMCVTGIDPSLPNARPKLTREAAKTSASFLSRPSHERSPPLPALP